MKFQYALIYHFFLLKTLYKDIEKSKSYIESRQNSWDSLHLTLPYWCVIQAMGHEGVITKIRHSMNISKIVGETIGKQRPFLKQIVIIRLHLM